MRGVLTLLSLPALLPHCMQDAAQRRHLLRLWVAPSAADGAMPLHPQYAEAWASVEPGARGGVYVPGNADTIPLEAEFGNKLAT